MQISNINTFQPAKNNFQKTSFGAIHPTKYFIKSPNNTFVQVTDTNTIKLLQRKIVGFLNKDANDRILTLQGKTPKPETDEIKTTRKRLMRFFAAHDKDYEQRRMVCSFYDTRYKGTLPYIFTGNSAEDVTNIAKPIGQLKSALHSKINSLRNRYGVSIEEARKMLPKEEEALYNAQSNYYRTLYRIINEEVKPDKIGNSNFNLYFEPVKIKRKTDYNLLNAMFCKRMI